MSEGGITYGRIDETLRTIGFGVRVLKGKARVYRHEATGAAIYLPDVSLDAKAIPHHLLVVRTVLNDFNIADPTGLLTQLHHVS